MSRSELWPSVFAGLLLSAIPASASPVTFFFTGHVNSEAINGCGFHALPTTPVTYGKVIKTS